MFHVIPIILSKNFFFSNFPNFQSRKIAFRTLLPNFQSREIAFRTLLPNFQSREIAFRTLVTDPMTCDNVTVPLHQRPWLRMVLPLQNIAGRLSTVVPKFSNENNFKNFLNIIFRRFYNNSSCEKCFGR